MVSNELRHELVTINAIDNGLDFNKRLDSILSIERCVSLDLFFFHLVTFAHALFKAFQKIANSCVDCLDSLKTVVSYLVSSQVGSVLNLDPNLRSL